MNRIRPSGSHRSTIAFVRLTISRYARSAVWSRTHLVAQAADLQLALVPSAKPHRTYSTCPRRALQVGPKSGRWNARGHQAAADTIVQALVPLLN
jgi:hypothetical protein